MLNTDKEGARLLLEGLARYGCRFVALCPGSRDVPLLMAADRSAAPGLRRVSFVDERVASFAAMGWAAVTGEPAAVVVTSGSAMLNCAPALAEAFYRRVPLVLVTADRPSRWIDQDDSQTLHQPGALPTVTLGCWDLRGELADADERALFCRKVNEALQRATTGRRGPVHINIAFDEPLTHEAMVPSCEPFRKIDLVLPEAVLSVAQARSLAAEMAGRRTLIVGGFHAPSAPVSRALARLASLPGVAVVAEALANVHAQGILEDPDSLLAAMTASEKEALRPDILITFGGALVSRQLKEWLRSAPPAEHWHVGHRQMLIDCFQALTRRIEIPAAGFFPRLAGSAAHCAKEATSPAQGYATSWASLSRRALAVRSNFMEAAPWADITALATLIAAIPTQWNLQLGNGMSVRLAQYAPLQRLHRVDANRGVSGIDGCLSTALGASAAYAAAPTLLVIGDMSAQYDVGALASSLLTELGGRFKMAVTANGGGNIFRYLKSTRSLPELPERLEATLRLPLRQLAQAWGMRYFCAASPEELQALMPYFIAEAQAPCLLELRTDPALSAATARAYLRAFRNTSLLSPEH